MVKKNSTHYNYNSTKPDSQFSIISGFRMTESSIAFINVSRETVSKVANHFYAKTAVPVVVLYFDDFSMITPIRNTVYIRSAIKLSAEFYGIGGIERND